MTSDFIFTACNTVAIIGWFLLIVISPFWFQTDKLVIGMIVTLFAMIYTWLITQSLQSGDFEKFSTLDGVMDLFTNKTAVTAGWVHYLAFDLMTGTWIKKNAEKYNMNHWLLIPCLLFTFMMGPVGLLMYLILRLIKTKQYFADNY